MCVRAGIDLEEKKNVEHTKNEEEKVKRREM